MRIGLFLTNQHLFGSDMQLALREQLALATLAKAAGWDGIFTGQHFLAAPYAQLQPFPFLARLAAEATGMDLGLAIALAGLTNPVEFAENVASLDVICGGRLIVGVGRGYRSLEFDAFALGRHGATDRMFTNTEIIKTLLTGKPVTARLSNCILDDAALSLLPIQRPRPPFWIGASSDGAIVRAAPAFDGWVVNPTSSANEALRLQNMWSRARTDAHLDVGDIAAFREVYCAPSRDVALEHVGHQLQDKYEVYSKWQHPRIEGVLEPSHYDLKDSFSTPFVVGSPQQCLDQLRWWRDVIGASYIVIRTDWPNVRPENARASLDLLSREVLPALRSEEMSLGRESSGDI